MRRFRKDQGFTLVELMVVVLIIGILVAIAIPVFNIARARAESRTCQANQRTIEGAAQTFLADEVGNTLTELDADPMDATNLLVVDTDSDGWGDYIGTLPVCPTAGGGYQLANGDASCATDVSGH